MTLKEEKVSLLKEVDDYIPKLVDGLEEIVICIQSGKDSIYLKSMIYAIEGVDWVLNALLLAGEIQSNDLEVKSINATLKSILESMEIGDYILISDIIEYELLPIIRNLKK